MDCEFTQLNRDSKLISLALVSEAGHEYYVELTDTYVTQDCSEFVIQNVLPQLNLAAHGQTLAEAQSSLLAFLSDLEGPSRFAPMLQNGIGIFLRSGLRQQPLDSLRRQSRNQPDPAVQATRSG